MTLLEQLQNDVKIAMKARDKERVSVLRMLCSDLKNVRINTGQELSPEAELKVLSTAAKKRKDSISIFTKSDRADLAEKEASELKILEAYLPAQMDDAAVTALITAAISATGAQSAKDIGLVMKQLMPQVQGRADGKTINRLVASLLS